VPELPEVETIRRDLAGPLLGRRIARVRVHHDDLILGGTSRRTFQRRVRGLRIGVVGRRAKYLLFPLHRPPRGDLDRDVPHGDAPHRDDEWAPPPEYVMRVQLRMTGQFAIGARRPVATDFRHPGIDLLLDDGNTLYYDDVRRLGGFDLLTPAAWEAVETRLGPEPLSAKFTISGFGKTLAPLRAPIKNVLLDQRRLAGVGNIYASEALFRARIDPRRPAGSLSRDEIARLRRAVRAVLRAALRKAGTTIRDYRAVNGRSGSFQNELRVYGRAGAPCRSCKTPVARLVQSGRSTFFCPRCQND